MTTKLGGFYINSGRLEIKEMSDNSDDDFLSPTPVKKSKKRVYYNSNYLLRSCLVRLLYLTPHKITQLPGITLVTFLTFMIYSTNDNILLLKTLTESSELQVLSNTKNKIFVFNLS